MALTTKREVPMNNEDKLLKHYTALLNSLAVYVEENGFLYTKKKSESETKIPVTLLNKRMVLPQKSILDKPDWETMVAFHPLSESVVRGESEVLQWLKERVIGRVTALACVTITHLAMIASTKVLQENLSQQQLTTIAELGDADDKTMKFVEELMSEILRGNEDFLHIYLRHSGKKGNNTYRRFAKVSFPLYEKLKAGEAVPALKNCRQKDTKFIIKALEEVLPDIGKEDHYSYGSLSEVAPYYHCLIHAFANVGKPISATVYNFRKIMADIVDSRVLADDWLEDWAGVTKTAGFYPQLQHNIGLAGNGEEVPTAEKTVAEEKPVQQTAKSINVQNDVTNPVDNVNRVIEESTATGFKLKVFNAPEKPASVNPYNQDNQVPKASDNIFNQINNGGGTGLTQIGNSGLGHNPFNQSNQSNGLLNPYNNLQTGNINPFNQINAGNVNVATSNNPFHRLM